MMDVQPVSLSDAARERYLSYALSVITSRALPDVRDGLKPVQRRILYTMFHELGLHPTGRYRKCAAVVGDVMGKYHPHGDQSIYDALVRMAQDFSLREPLVDPQGNFGSLDGDPPAAMRYTECRLTAIAEELLQELKKDTVDSRPTYDGQHLEPVVLPAQFPQLLVNGVEGIAVGLSTRIPPHNLAEVIDACLALIDGEAHDVGDLLRHVQGPDFPTGGQILNDAASIREIYETGQGSFRVRGTYVTEKEGRARRVVITSIPYGVNKSKLVETIGEAVETKKLPQVTDVRDESTEVVRVVLDLKGDASAEAVMAWVYKRTPLEGTFPVYMNALVPSADGGLPTPERLDLAAVLQHWLDFRYETVRRRLTFDLKQLEERIHVLEGFAIIFADLDEVIRLIRESEGKKDAARRLIERFGLSEIQTDAILELRLYKLARLEIQLILDELEAKRADAAAIRELLGSETKLWGRVRAELVEVRGLYGTPRRTTIGEAPELLDFDESAYIVREETFVVVTRGGWVKRQSSFTEVDRIRVREGDEIGWLFRADTHTAVTFLSSDGAAYTLRVDQIPSTSGHGKPLSTFFSLSDGASVVGVIPHDPVMTKDLPPDPAPPAEDPAPPYVVSVTRHGRIQKLPLETYAEPSNKNGRLYARLAKGDEVVAAYVAMGGEFVCIATREANVLVFPLAEASTLKAAGKGTTAIKLKGSDGVLAFELATGKEHGPTVLTGQGREVVVTPRAYLGSRAARGRQLLRRDGFDRWVRGPWIGKIPTRDGQAGPNPGGEE